MECKKCKGAIPDGAPFCPWCGMRQEKPKGVKTRTNGTGTAFRRGKGWTAEVTLGYKEDGKRIKRTKDGFRTKAEAINYCAVLLETPRPKRTPLLCNYWDLYYGRQMEDLSESKRTSYKIAWNKLQAISRMPVNKITVADLQEAISSTCKTFYPARDAKQLLSNLFNSYKVQHNGKQGQSIDVIEEAEDPDTRRKLKRQRDARGRIRQIYKSYLAYINKRVCHVFPDNTSLDVLLRSAADDDGESNGLRELYIRARYSENESFTDDDIKKAKRHLNSIKAIRQKRK